MRVGLVGCVRSKLDVAAPAQDRYPSPLFRGRRAWVERTCARWFILSSLHGLTDPEQVLEPYDVTLTELRAFERERWSARVLRASEAAIGPLGEHVFEIHAGSAYADHGLAAGLCARGARVERPMRGLTLGQQLSAYGESRGPQQEPEPPADVVRSQLVACRRRGEHAAGEVPALVRGTR